MKIKRFFAKTMSGALQQVREEQGPDSVILSNRKVADGIEVIAAVDYDEALIRQTVGYSGSAASVAESPPATRDSNPPTITDPDAPVAIVAESGELLREAVAQPTPADDSELAAMRQELKAMRSIMQHQLSQLSWNDLQRRQPHRAAVVKRLMQLGLDSQLIESLMSAIPPHKDSRNTWRNGIGLLSKRIPLATDDICETGGIFALVGPTGVGKTTTIAKLATRCALRHGAGSVGLVTTDGYRIGTQEHLLRFGKILGVPVQVATTVQTLHSAIDQLDSKILILIDTAGFSQRDPHLIEQLAGFSHPHKAIRTLLTLSANTQTECLKETIRLFGRLELDGTIVTKLDEATSLGGLLSATIIEHLTIWYVADGQRIPEDIGPAAKFRAELISRAVTLTHKYASELPEERPQRLAKEEAKLRTFRQRAVMNG